MLPKAVLFDVGDTLLYFSKDSHRVSLESVGCLDALSLDAYKFGVEHAVREWRESGGAPGLEDLSETWVGHYVTALRFAGFRGNLELTAQRIEESFLTDGWEVFPEVHSALEQLRKRDVRLGVVSNWPKRLRDTLKAAGLDHYFELVVASGVVGFAKPHPEIFRIALSRLGLSPEAVLFVGDKIHLDIEGPAGVGMPSVLIDRQRRFPQRQDRIETLDELLDYLPWPSV